MLGFLVDAFDAAVRVRHADSQHATIGVGHGNDGYNQRFGTHLDALAVEGLSFRQGLYVLNSICHLFRNQNHLQSYEKFFKFARGDCRFIA